MSTSATYCYRSNQTEKAHRKINKPLKDLKAEVKYIELSSELKEVKKVYVKSNV